MIRAGVHYLDVEQKVGSPWNRHLSQTLCHMPFFRSKSRRQAQLDRIEGVLHRLYQLSLSHFSAIERHQDMTDTSLDDILAETTAEQTADASIVTLLNGLQAQLTQALNGATLTPSQQAKVNQIFANMQANVGTITAAVQANTPAAPTSTPVTVAPAPSPSTVTVAPPVATDTAVAITPTPIPTGAPVTTAPASTTGTHVV